MTLDLTRYFPATTDSPRWRTYCLDVRDLPLEANAGSHLIIIAGVGGDLMTEFIAELAKRHPSMTFDLLLCPVHHTYTLREQLIALNAELKSERLVEENQRIYELLHVQLSPSSGLALTLSLWSVSRCGKSAAQINQRSRSVIYSSCNSTISAKHKAVMRAQSSVGKRIRPWRSVNRWIPL